MQSIQGAVPRPPEGLQNSPSVSAEVPLSPGQRHSLEQLVSRITAITQQQIAKVWSDMKQEIGLTSESPLLSRHFPAAEQSLNQRLAHARAGNDGQQSPLSRTEGEHNDEGKNNTLPVRPLPESEAGQPLRSVTQPALLTLRQLMQQISELLPLENNRQRVSNFIREQFGLNSLSQLTPQQLKTVLTLLQNSLLTDKAVQRPDHQPAERSQTDITQAMLKRQVEKLAASTGESDKTIWRTMQEISGTKITDTLSARQVTQLTNWLQVRQTLSQHPNPTLHTLQDALKQTQTPTEEKEMAEYAQQRFQATPQMTLSTGQVQDILNQIFLKRAGRDAVTTQTDEQHLSPIASPMFSAITDPFKTLATKPALAFTAIFILLLSLWLLF